MLRIREIRKAKRPKMTIEALAERAGLDVSALSRIERGQRWPTPETLSEIAKGLDVPAYQLIADYKPLTEKESELDAIIRDIPDDQLDWVLSVVRAVLGRESRLQDEEASE